MKHKALLLACLLAAACSSHETQEIEASAMGYLQAMGDYMMDEAIPHASRHTREHTIPTLKHIMANADTAYINSNRPSVITITGTKKLTDSTARVFYHKHTPIKEVDDSVTLVLEEGRWLVDVHLSPLPFSGSTTRDSVHRITHLPSIDSIKKNLPPLQTPGTVHNKP